VLGGECGVCGGEVCTGFWCGNLKERDLLQDLSIDGSIKLTWILNNRMKGHGLDSSGSDRDKWYALVNTVLNLSVL
jgi:hypothetical protein